MTIIFTDTTGVDRKLNDYIIDQIKYGNDPIGEPTGYMEIYCVGAPDTFFQTYGPITFCKD